MGKSLIFEMHLQLIIDEATLIINQLIYLVQNFIFILNKLVNNINIFMEQYLGTNAVEPNLSFMDWKGSRSRRFSGGKIHFNTRDNFFNGIVVTDNQNQTRGQKYFPIKYSEEHKQRSCIKNFQYANQSIPTYKPQGLRVTGFQPLPVKSRAQKSHIRDTRAPIQYHDLKIGIKTYAQANKITEGQYFVQDKMQRKMRATKLDAKTFYGTWKNENNTINLNSINNHSNVDRNVAYVKNNLSSQDQKLVRDLDNFNPKIKK